MFENVPSARLALSMTLFEIVSAPLLVIVASPDSVWFFHIESQSSYIGPLVSASVVIVRSSNSFNQVAPPDATSEIHEVPMYALGCLFVKLNYKLQPIVVVGSAALLPV